MTFGPVRHFNLTELDQLIMNMIMGKKSVNQSWGIADSSTVEVICLVLPICQFLLLLTVPMES